MVLKRGGKLHETCNVGEQGCVEGRRRFAVEEKRFLRGVALLVQNPVDVV